MDDNYFDNIDWFFGEDFKTVNIEKIEEQTFDYWFDCLFEHNKKNNDSRGRSQTELALQALRKLEFYFAIKRKEKSYLLAKEDNSFWISKTIQENLSFSNDTTARDKAIGAIIECLFIMCNAKKNRLVKITRESVTKWLLSKRTTTNAAHKLFLKTSSVSQGKGVFQIIVDHGDEMKKIFNSKNHIPFVVEKNKSKSRDIQHDKLRNSFIKLEDWILNGNGYWPSEYDH